MKIRFLKLVKLIFVGNQFPNNEKNHLCSYELKGQKKSRRLFIHIDLCE